ncbi:MAG: DUF692 family multinuclear iron-containing protein, partial [Chloroflexota bacterium]
MVRIAVDSSDVLLSLLSRHAIEIDFVKVDGDNSMELLNEALSYKPVLIHDVNRHFWLNYENPFQDEVMATARKMLDTAKPPWFSTGIGASAEPQGQTLPFWRGADASALQTREQVTANILRNARRLKDWLGIPLLLENYNYHATNAYEYVCEPDYFSSLIEQIDCGVLLDLSHAQISAHNMGWGHPTRYLEALPLDRVREIHVSHPEIRDGQMLDMHYPIQQSDMDLLRWVLAHTPAEVVSLEVNENLDDAILLAQV